MRNKKLNIQFVLPLPKYKRETIREYYPLPKYVYYNPKKETTIVVFEDRSKEMVKKVKDTKSNLVLASYLAIVKRVRGKEFLNRLYQEGVVTEDYLAGFVFADYLSQSSLINSRYISIEYIYESLRSIKVQALELE